MPAFWIRFGILDATSIQNTGQMGAKNGPPERARDEILVSLQSIARAHRQRGAFAWRNKAARWRKSVGGVFFCPPEKAGAGCRGVGGSRGQGDLLALSSEQSGTQGGGKFAGQVVQVTTEPLGTIGAKTVKTPRGCPSLDIKSICRVHPPARFPGFRRQPYSSGKVVSFAELPPAPALGLKEKFKTIVIVIFKGGAEDAANILRGLGMGQFFGGAAQSCKPLRFRSSCSAP
jgi:hypothetical protein